MIALLFILGFLASIILIVIETISSSVGQYLLPSKTMFGVLLLHVVGFIFAIFVARNNHEYIEFLQKKLRSLKSNEIDNMRNGFLVLSLIFFTSFFMNDTDFVSVFGRYFSENLILSLMANLLLPCLSVLGLFCWVGSILIDGGDVK